MVSTRCSVNLGGWDDDSKAEGLFPAPSLVSAGLSVVTQDRCPCPIMEVRPEGRPATLAAHQQHRDRKELSLCLGRLPRALSILGPQCPVWVGGGGSQGFENRFQDSRVGERPPAEGGAVRETPEGFLSRGCEAGRGMRNPTQARKTEGHGRRDQGSDPGGRWPRRGPYLPSGQQGLCSGLNFTLPPTPATPRRCVEILTHITWEPGLLETGPLWM